MPNHVHLFVSAQLKYAPAQIIEIFKGASSRLWTSSYFVATAGNVSADVIMEY